MSQFNEVLAHHLQEPVRLQHVYTQLLARQLPQPMPAAIQQACQIVMDGAVRLRALPRDVQLYLALGQPPPPVLPCSLDAAVTTALWRLKDRMAECGADIQCEDLPHVMLQQNRAADVITILAEPASG